MISPALRNLTEDKIEVLGPRPVILGAWDYFLGDKVRHALVYVDRLRGKVAANTGDYRPEVVCGENGQLSSQCDCPSRLPFCKHAVALLYLWANRPEQFIDLEGLTAPLSLCQPDQLTELLAAALMAGDGGVELIRRAVSDSVPVVGRALSEGLAAPVREAVEMATGGRFREAAGMLLAILRFGPALFLGEANRQILSQVPGHYRDTVVAWNPGAKEALTQIIALVDLPVPSAPDLAEGIEATLSELWGRFEGRLGGGNRVIESRLLSAVWALEAEMAGGFRPGLAYRRKRLIRLLAERLRARGDQAALARLLQGHPGM